MRLNARFSLFALLSSIVPLLGVAVMSFFVARDSLQQKVEEQLIVAAGEQVQILQATLDDSVRSLNTWSGLAIMKDALIQSTFSGTKDVAEVELVRLRDEYPMFAELHTIAMDGVVTASTAIETRWHSVSNSPEFGSASQGQTYQGPVAIDRILGIRTLTLAAPIYQSYRDRTVVGVLVGFVDWEKINQQLKEVKILGHRQDPQRQLVLQQYTDKRMLHSVKNVDIARRIVQVAATDDDSMKPHLESLDIPYLVATAATTDGTHSLDPQWMLHVVLERDTAFESIALVRDRLLLIGVFATVLVVIVGQLFARSIIKPINRLVARARSVAYGNLDVHFPVIKGTDEVSQLTRSFSAMCDSIRANRLELEERTVQAEQVARLKGEFLANMSHEIRTPINGVMGMTELLLLTKLDSGQNKYASTILRSAQSLLGVINDILDFSKIEAGKLELQECPFDLREVVDDVVEMLAESAHRKGLELTVQLDPDSHLAYRGDSGRLRQILINLLGNAIKFTSEGEVRLRVSRTRQSGQQTELRFDVIDTGIGIVANARQRIFESFVQADGSTTRKFGGTGLGLAISASLVDLMQGEIGVDSEPGKGSVFWFTTLITELPSECHDEWVAPDALLGRRVLVVDDNKTNRDILSDQLGYWGADFRVACDGQEGLTEMCNAAERGSPFDLVVLDMHMPGMDGYELAEAIRANVNLKGARLVLLSSVSDQWDTPGRSQSIMNASLTKPVRQAELYQCLSGLFSVDRVVSRKTTEPVKAEEWGTLEGHVLLVEDNAVNQLMMTKMLEKLGLTVTVAEQGVEALAHLETTRFELILMDCQMPIMDGFEATAEIRRREAAPGASARISIIALTANALEGDRQACLDAGMDDYLSKPISRQRLHDVLQYWLEGESEQRLAA